MVVPFKERCHSALHPSLAPAVSTQECRLAETSTKLEADIRHSYEALPSGARVVITTKRKDALTAVHEFLCFQIKDHSTGDPLEIAGR